MLIPRVPIPLLLAPLLAALSGLPAAATDFVVTASGMSFSPGERTIQVGDTVTFKNLGGDHNVRANDDSFRCAHGCDDDGGNGAISSDWTFTRVFNAAGVVPYYCENHGSPGGGMHGTITVIAAPPPPPAGALRFANPAYSVREGTSAATIAVSRVGGSSGAVGVRYSTTGQTATAGSDFTSVTGTLSWADGDTADKSFNVPIVNDTLVEPTETVRLTLSSPTGGATLGTASVILSILDNDTAGTAPAAPAQLTATATELNGATLAWQDKSNNETSFRLQFKKLGESDFNTGETTPTNTPHLAVNGLDQDTAYVFRVRAENASGPSAFSDEVVVTTDTAPATCVADATTLCLGAGGRFQSRIHWRKGTDPVTDQGAGSTVPLPANPDSGLYYFFSAGNIEALLKVLNACGLTPARYWVFFAATTNVEFTLRVTDAQTGKQQTYFNALGHAAAPVQDTNAFATCP